MRQHCLVASVKYLFPRPLEVQYTDIEEMSTRVQAFGLNKKSIISERTLRLRGIFVENVQKSNIDTVLDFFVAFIFLRYWKWMIGNEMCITQNFLELKYNQLFLWKFPIWLQIILNTFETILHSPLVLQALKATINLRSINVLCILGSQCIIGRVLS